MAVTNGSNTTQVVYGTDLILMVEDPLNVRNGNQLLTPLPTVLKLLGMPAKYRANRLVSGRILNMQR